MPVAIVFQTEYGCPACGAHLTVGPAAIEPETQVVHARASCGPCHRAWEMVVPTTVAEELPFDPDLDAMDDAS